MKSTYYVVLFLLFNNIVFSQSDTITKHKKIKVFLFKSLNDSVSKNTHFELSFGQNLLFISNERQNKVRLKEAIVLTTSAVLFFVEFRPQKTLRIPVFLNIATESKQFIVNGQLINEKASPTFGSGIVFKAVEFRIDDKSKIELELGPLSSFIIDSKSNVRVAPVLAARLKICRGANFIMYIGGNYSIGINAFGIMYGTGTTF